MGLLFEGLKVIDCGSFIAAPAAATIFSDFGADVVKIEPPGAGDPYRHLTKLPGHPKSDQNYAWMLGSRNKRSLAVDMAKPEGRTAIQRLASQADVFITNYPAAARKKLGIGYEALSALNDRLIYASFSGYGENGAEATKPGFDVTAWWARSGLMDTVRASSESVPVRPANGMGDHSAGFTLFSGIVMALYQRQNTGKGTEVTSSLVANGLWANGYNAQAALCGATFTDRAVYVNPNTSVSYGHQFVNVSVDRAGNLYLVFTDDHNLYYSFSIDHGTSWSAPSQINQSPSSTAIMPWSVAGGAGKLDVVWYGTSYYDGVNTPDNYPSSAAWYVYFAQTLQATTPGSSFTPVPASGIVHYGGVCEGGVACTAPANRDLLDDFGVATSPTTGLATIIYTSDQYVNTAAEPARAQGSTTCNASTSNSAECSHTDIAVQTGGSGVIAP